VVVVVVVVEDVRLKICERVEGDGDGVSRWRSGRDDSRGPIASRVQK